MKNLNEMTAKELKEMAKRMKISNWWNLKKSVLIEKIEAAQNMTEEEKQQLAEEQEKEDKLFEHYSNNWRKYGMTNNWTKFIDDYRKGKIELIEDIFAEEHVEEETDRVCEEIEEEIQDEVAAEEETKAQVQEEEKQKKNNGWEKIAKENIDNAYNWIVGGYENSVLDGEMTQEEVNEWVKNNAVNEIYDEAISTRYTGDSCGGEAPKEMRFATKKWCVKYIVELLRAEGYKVNIEEEIEGHKPTPKRGALIEWNGKSQNICAWGKELGISANTLYGRIYKMGWDVEKAFTTRPR